MWSGVGVAVLAAGLFVVSGAASAAASGPAEGRGAVEDPAAPGGTADGPGDVAAGKGPARKELATQPRAGREGRPGRR